VAAGVAAAQEGEADGQAEAPQAVVVDVNHGLINPVYGCLIGRVPLKKYQIMAIGGVPS
jgi:hypothetical protein